MTDQQIYNVAEWLTYNADSVKFLIGERATKDAMEDSVMYKVAEHFPDLSAEEVELVFQDERVRIVLYKYYLKEFEYEH